MRNLVIPKRLSKGDTIGIVCPSAPINEKARHRIENAQKMLEKLGYKVLLGKYLIGSSYTSGSVEERVQDLHSMFENPNVTCVIAGIGGNHSNHLLPYINYDLIRNNPKIFVGYSDITVMHYALNSQADLATYYGPCAATQFGEYPEILEYTLKHFDQACTTSNETRQDERSVQPSPAWTEEFLDWFQKKDLERPRALLPNKGYRWLEKGEVSGPSLPACILSMNRLAGTKYWIDPAGCILFLDVLISPGELDEALVDSFLTDLRNLGVFESIRGLVISRPYGYTLEAKERLYSLITSYGKGKYPIVADFDLGHTDPMITIRYGQEVRLDSVRNEVIFIS